MATPGDLSALTAVGQASASDAFNSQKGMDLANTMQQTALRQKQQEVMQQNIDMSKANSFHQRMLQQNGIIDDVVRGKVAKLNDQWAQQAGVATDPEMFQTMSKSDQMRQNFNAMADQIGPTLAHPEGAKQYLAGISSLQGAEGILSAGAEAHKANVQKQLEQITGQYKVQAAAAGREYNQQKTDEASWQKAAEKFNDPSSRALIGRYQQNLDKANTLQTLADTIGGGGKSGETEAERIERFNKADPQQLYEFAKAADNLTSSTGNSVYGTEHAMPKDMDISMANMKQWLPKELGGGGQPMPANAGEFANKFLKQAQAEKGYYSHANQMVKNGLGVGYERLQSLDPSRWQRLTNPEGGLPAGNSTAPTNIAPPTASADKTKKQALTPAQIQLATAKLHTKFPKLTPEALQQMVIQANGGQ